MYSTHSIRIGPTVIDDWLLKLSDISGVAIIKHTDSKREHAHVFLRHREIGISKDTLSKFKKEIISKYNLNGELLKTNSDWSWTNPNTSVESFYQYAMYEKGAKQLYKRPGASVLLWNLPETMDLPPDRPITIIVKNPTIKVNTFVKRERFYKYCKEYFSENPETDLSRKEVAKLLFHYWKAGGEEGAERLMIAKEYINSAMYKLLKDSGDTVRMDLFEESWILQAIK